MFCPLFQSPLRHSPSLDKWCSLHTAPAVVSLHYHCPNLQYQPSLLYSVRPTLNRNKSTHASGQTGEHTHPSPTKDSSSTFSSLHLEDLEGIHRDLHLAILDQDDNSCHEHPRPGRGEVDIVTEHVKDILRGVYAGNRASLAEAITLGECL